jgi:hypothetical protein
MDPDGDVEDSPRDDVHTSGSSYGRRHIALYAVVAVVDYLGALYVLTEIAHLSHASGLLLAFLWLVPVFGVLWLVGVFDPGDRRRGARGWPYAHRESAAEGHEAGAEVHEPGAFVGSASTRDRPANHAA